MVLRTHYFGSVAVSTKGLFVILVRFPVVVGTFVFVEQMPFVFQLGGQVDFEDHITITFLGDIFVSVLEEILLSKTLIEHEDFGSGRDCHGKDCGYFGDYWYFRFLIAENLLISVEPLLENFSIFCVLGSRVFDFFIIYGIKICRKSL